MADQDFNIKVVTTADTKGIQQTSAELDKLKTNQQKAQEEQDKAVAAGVKSAAAWGTLIGGTIAKGINDLAAAQVRVTRELEQQGELLVKNVIAWRNLAQGSETFGQLADAGEKAVTQIDLLKQKFNEANQETLTAGQTIQDQLVKIFTLGFQTGPYQALLDEKIRGLLLDLTTAERAAADIFKSRFDEIRRVAAGIDPEIRKTTQDLENARRLLSNLNPKDNLESWVAQEQVVERLNKRLQDMLRLREQMIRQGQPTTPVGVIQQQLGQLTNLPAGLPLSTTDETLLRNAQIDTERRLRDAQIAEEARQRSLDASAQGRAPSFLRPQLPGESAQDYNAEILVALQRMITLWSP